MDSFSVEYQKLNSAQRLAVDTIEGPVMVVAGAGTGKTQTIALRIANILRQTQTSPSSILCLTFTESAALNMRQRLLKIVGPTAYLVKVHTFHSFCNEIIQSNSDYFVLAKEARVVDELEQIEIYRQLIDSLPDGAALKPWGDKYFYLKDLSSLVQTLKRENISPESLKTLIDAEKYFVDQSADIFDQIRSLRSSKELSSQILALSSKLLEIPRLFAPIGSLITYHLSLFNNGGYDVGPAKSPAVNFKNALLKLADGLSKNIPKQSELFQVYQGYQSALSRRGRYDFDDMILFVLKSFTQDPQFLLEYQEKFQYILVDEYQDTNSSQNQIVELLGNYYDSPNIFVVGDDDQSIFRFQGASLENLQYFISRYHVQPIVLTNNYRSHQLILDSAAELISHNRNRLGSLIKEIDKTLKSNVNFDPTPINLTVAADHTTENYLVAQKIKQLISQGIDLTEIAVLYRNNRDVDGLVEFLNRENIPFYLSADRDILKSKPIIHLIKLLQLISDPTDKTLVYPVLCSEFIDFPSLDLLRLTRGEKLSKSANKKLRRFNRLLARSRVRLERYPLDRFFNYVIRRFKFLDFCLQSADISLISQLHTFYSELKRLSQEENYDLTQFLHRLQLYTQNNLSLPTPPPTPQSQPAIQLLTAHRAKGLEFSHVFVIQVIDKKWGNNPDRSLIKLPPGVVATELSAQIADDNEDERRLFYVALTRAKSQIYLSYSLKNSAGRDQLPSIFLSEINPSLVEPVTISPESSFAALKSLFSLQSSPIVPSTKLTDYLANYLKNEYVLNITHLNSYLRCPLCFYHRSILRIPQAKDKYSSFGTAIHAALSEKYGRNGDPLTRFVQSLEREQLSSADHQESLSKGTKLLTDYFSSHHLEDPKNYQVDYDFKRNNVHLDHIPLTGKIDLIHFLDANQVEFVDFKTGNPDGKSQELSEAGDYFRQLVFYQLLSLLDPNFKYQVVRGTIDFVEKSKQKNSYVRKEFKITDAHLESLKDLIGEVYQKILSQDFFHVGPTCRNKNNLHYLLK